MEEQEYNQSDATLFVKIGIVVLSVIAVIGLGMKLLPDAVTVSNIGKRRDLPIYSVDIEDKKVSLSFDTAWGNEDIQTVLDILDKQEVKATFFMTGEWIDKYPEDVKKIAKAGHDLGNHSENHKQMSQLSADQSKDEIMMVHDRVKKLTGIDMSLFRVPYGDYNNTVIGTARDSGYYTIQWDVDSQDWKDYGASDIVKKCTDNKDLGNGSIILLHNGAKHMPHALEDVIKGLKDQGYELVPVSELIYKDNYTVDHM